MTHPRYRSVLVLPLLGASACIEDPTGEMTAETQQAATASFKFCEAHGSWCVGAPTINVGDPILEESGGRLFQVKQQVTAEGETITRFIFNQDTSKCMAPAVSGQFISVRLCSAEDVDWESWLGPDKKSCLFQNVSFKTFLSGPNGKNAGGEFTLQTNGANGWFQQFTNPGIVCLNSPPI
jgi:hypothetical protein